MYLYADVLLCRHGGDTHNVELIDGSKQTAIMENTGVVRRILSTITTSDSAIFDNGEMHRYCRQLTTVAAAHGDCRKSCSPAIVENGRFASGVFENVGQAFSKTTILGFS